jgi:hypothetical protein
MLLLHSEHAAEVGEIKSVEFKIVEVAVSSKNTFCTRIFNCVPLSPYPGTAAG